MWRRRIFRYWCVHLSVSSYLKVTANIMFLGLVVKEKNYLEVFVYDKWSGHYIPDFEEGQEFDPTTCEVREGQTSKPNYLTEADLVTLMDKNGIGMLVFYPIHLSSDMLFA